MGIRQNGDVLRQVHTLFHAGTAGNMTDGQLLERYADGERMIAELAFATLVERHGPMVLRVCRRVLGDPHEAQDAFQATFLVLARRVSSLRRRDSLGSWLHGVALRVAGSARKAEARRRWYERQCAERADRVMEHDQGGLDLGPVLHEELGRLPERFRAPIVLCYLEGLSCEQAAERLNRPVGTVKSRLSRGREALRGRLVRRGLAPTAGMLAAALAAEGVAGTVPAALVGVTARAATALAAGKAAMAGAVPVAAAELMEGVLKTMAIIHRSRIAAGVLALGVVASGAGALSRSAAGDDPPVPPHETAKVTLPEYVVEPPDLIRVDVQGLGQPLTGERLVRPDGRINLDEYGEVYVAGLTPMEIRKKLTTHLEAWIKELERSGPGPGGGKHLKARESAGPLRVNVDVVAYNSKCYYVQGRVAEPGRFPVTGSETVLDAITYAGGVTPRSTSVDVRLVRPARPGAAGKQVLKVDLDAIVARGETATNYQLFPGDRVLVLGDVTLEPDRDAPRPTSGAGDLKRLENRLAEVERRLDRVIELLDGRPNAESGPLEKRPTAEPGPSAKPNRPRPLQR